MALRAPLFEVPVEDRLVFERTLGHPEMLGSHKWISSNEPKCRICNKLCYTIFVWNWRVQNEATHRYKFFKQSTAAPVAFNRAFESTNPIIIVNGKVH